MRRGVHSGIKISPNCSDSKTLEPFILRHEMLNELNLFVPVLGSDTEHYSE